MKRYCVLLVGGMFLTVAAICVGQVPPSSSPPIPVDVPHVVRLPPIPESGEVAKSEGAKENKLAPVKSDEGPVPSDEPIHVGLPVIPISDGRSQRTVKKNVEPAKTDEVKEKSVEELLGRLDALKAQQEELDKAKKETVTLLKEKLKQQKQRLQNLGVTVEEEAVRPRNIGKKEELDMPPLLK